MSITEQLQAAIKRNPGTLYAISQEAGCRPETLYRFMDGTSTLKLDTVDALCRVLGLELRPAKGRRRNRKN